MSNVDSQHDDMHRAHEAPASARHDDHLDHKENNFDFDFSSGPGRDTGVFSSQNTSKRGSNRPSCRSPLLVPSAGQSQPSQLKHKQGHRLETSSAAPRAAALEVSTRSSGTGCPTGSPRSANRLILPLLLAVSLAHDTTVTSTHSDDYGSTDMTLTTTTTARPASIGASAPEAGVSSRQPEEPRGDLAASEGLLHGQL